MKLARLLRLYRVAERLTSQEVADDIGILKRTYYRLEQGKDVSGEHLVKVLNWLFKNND